MNVATDSLAHAYRERRGRFVSDERFGDWRLKLYGLADPEKGVRDELLAATRELAQRSVPPVHEAYGAGFAIAHDAAFPIALIYWWQGTNELHQRVYAGSAIDDLSAVTLTPAGCVYELAIVEFERRAWVDDVIGNPDGPDLERYLSRRFDGMT